MLERLTFDTEPILAFYLNEPGAETVKECLRRVQAKTAEGFMNIVNLTEIYYILHRKAPALAEEKCNALRLLGIRIVALQDNQNIWKRAAQIKAQHTLLSLADAYAAATAETLKSTLVVGNDKELENLKIKCLKIRP